MSKYHQFDAPTFKRTLFDVQKISLSTVPNHMLNNSNINKFYDELAHDYIYRLETYIASRTETKVTEVLRVPMDWFEHFKVRWFPFFLLTRYPVKYRVVDTRVTTTIMCPDVEVPSNIPSHIEKVEYNRPTTTNWREYETM